MLNKLCSMASHGYPPGLLPCHEQQSVSRAWKDCQPIFPIPGSKQDIVRLANPNLRTYQLDKQWRPISRFPESSQVMKIDSAFTRPVLVDAQGAISAFLLQLYLRSIAARQSSPCNDNLPGSVLFSFGIAERCARHEKVMKFLMSGAAKDGLDLSLMSDLMEFQITITDMRQHHAAANGPRSDARMEMEPSVVYPSRAIYAQESILKFVDDFLPHPAISVNPDGKISFVGSVTEMRDLLSVLAEFYLPKGSARWSRQTMLVPQFKWGGTVETPVFINDASLTLETMKVAPLKSPLKAKPKSTPRRKANKKAARERELHQKNYSQACETLLSLMMDKNRNARTVINSLKKSGPELPELLAQFSTTIAGTGLAVLFSIVCKAACGRLHFGAAKLLTTSLGVGLFWLSWAVNMLRDTVVCIRKKPAKPGSEEEVEMVKRLDRSVNDIFFRAAALTAVAVLRLA